MVFKRLGLFGFISAAAIVSGVLVGCSGSGANLPAVPPPIITTGGVSTMSGSAPVTGSSTTPQQVQVSTSSGTVIGTLPPGEAITNVGDVTVIPAGVPFLNNTLGPKVNSKKGLSNQLNPLLISLTGPTGTYVPTGVFVNSDTSLSAPLILVPSAGFVGGQAWLMANGPFSVSGTNAGSTALTVQTLSFGVVTLVDGLSSLPITGGLTLKIPANGGSTANGNYVQVTYPTPDFTTGTGSLQLTWPGIFKTQTKSVASGIVTFSDPLSDPTDSIPAVGITSVTFGYTP